MSFLWSPPWSLNRCHRFIKEICMYRHSQRKGVGEGRAAIPSHLLWISVLKIFLHSGIATAILLVRPYLLHNVAGHVVEASRQLTNLHPNGQPKGIRVILEWATVRVTYMRCSQAIKCYVRSDISKIMFIYSLMFVIQLTCIDAYNLISRRKIGTHTDYSS